MTTRVPSVPGFLVVLSMGVLVGCGDDAVGAPTDEPPATAKILELPAGWSQIEPGGETICARGDPFSYFVRPGTENKLIIDFRGGGACWNDLTCAFASSIFEDTVEEDKWVLDDAVARGIYDKDSAANPVADWHHVYIPYCTGDVHWGDNVATYGSTTIRHKGAVNVRAVLAWVYENVPDPEKVLVTGCSAGAYGSIMWSAHVRKQYQDAQVYQLADSGAGIITDDFFQQSFPSWNPQGSYPTWIEGLDPSAVSKLPELYQAVGGEYPDMRLSQYNTTYDEDQSFYFAAMGGGDAFEWSERMRAYLAELEETVPNFHSFLAPDWLHCIIPKAEMYTTESNGVRFVDWLGELVSDAEAGSVACEQDACGAPMPTDAN